MTTTAAVKRYEVRLRARAEVGRANSGTNASKTVITNQSAFRGTWQANLEKPERFGMCKYLPVAPPPREPEREAAQDDEPDVEPMEKENTSQQQQTTTTTGSWVVGERMLAPPSGVPIWITVMDRNRDFRSFITKDGTVVNAMGQTMGFVNANTREVGSASENFLGAVLANKWDNLYQIRGHREQLIGYIDMGTASVKDCQGATVVDLESGGVIKHPNGTYLGQFKGISGFHDMEIIALYLTILDYSMTGMVE